MSAIEGISTFGVVAGEVRFTWLTKHSLIASIDEFPRLVIGKGAAVAAPPGAICFATHFYVDENAPPERYILTIDEYWIAA